MKVYFDTLGCLKNFNDSDAAMGLLERKGHSITDDPEDADVIIVNTCGFIEDAKKESIDAIFQMADYRSQGKKLVVSGCLVQRYAAELYEEIPEADGFLGVNDYEKLPDLLDSLEEKDAARFSEASGEEVGREALERGSEGRKLPENPYSMSIRISEGCNNRCAYCAIPGIRGNYRSRSKESVLREAEGLAKAGCRELTVIAEDTSYYGRDLYGKPELADLLRRLCRIDGIEWIRILYAYPDSINDELIRVMASEPKICHYIDIPIQHASDRVLAAMNRHTTKAQIEGIIRKLREAMPDICIRTTMIVGFPGETEEDFGELQDFVNEQKFGRLGAFTYSREEGTPAAEMEDQIPEEVKQERLDALMTDQMEISQAANRAFVGRTVEVMVDGKDEDGVSYLGRTRYDAPDIDDAVIFSPKTDHKPGDIVKVLIQDSFDYDLEGAEI